MDECVDHLGSSHPAQHPPAQAHDGGVDHQQRDHRHHQRHPTDRRPRVVDLDGLGQQESRPDGRCPAEQAGDGGHEPVFDQEKARDRGVGQADGLHRPDLVHLVLQRAADHEPQAEQGDRDQQEAGEHQHDGDYPIADGVDHLDHHEGNRRPVLRQAGIRRVGGLEGLRLPGIHQAVLGDDLRAPTARLAQGGEIGIRDQEPGGRRHGGGHLGVADESGDLQRPHPRGGPDAEDVTGLEAEPLLVGDRHIHRPRLRMGHLRVFVEEEVEPGVLGDEQVLDEAV